MAVRKYKPTTPGRRGASVSDFGDITRNRPEKSLTGKIVNRAGRNANGRIHEGGEFSDVGATVNAWLGGKAPGRGIPGRSIYAE